MANYGFVYILSNSSMPNIYKIGYTDRSPMQRADELSRSTSVPTNFEVVAYGEVDDAQSVEREFHEIYADYRISSNREFFKLPVDLLIRELCINLREYCLNFTYCEAYEMLEWEIKQMKNEQISETKEILVIGS
jgi:hypothetical protein